MKTLLILRHAKSSWKRAESSDHDRPLNSRGKRAAPRMGKLLKQEKLVPDAILSSTAERARATAEAAAEACGYEGMLQLSLDLYLAEPETYVQVLHGVGDDCERVMVVGHNPGLEQLLDALTQEGDVLPTAALAQVELPIKRWRDLDSDTEGTLVNLWRPRELE